MDRNRRIHDYSVMIASDPLFSRRGLSLDRLASFLRVVEAGGIARAAPNKPAEQSQISRQIRELEEFFGHKLFDRRGRAIVPTPAGLHLAEISRSIFSGLADVAREAGGQPAPYAFGAGDSLLHWWILPKLGALSRWASFSISAQPSDEVRQRLLDGRLDLGVVSQASLHASLKSRALGSIEYSVFVPRNLAPPGAKTLAAALSKAPLVEQTTELEPNTHLERAAKKAGVTLSPALAVETFPQAARAVSSGAYAALLPGIARADLPSNKFTELRLEISAKRALFLSWHPSLFRRRPSAERLIDQLEDRLRL